MFLRCWPKFLITSKFFSYVNDSWSQKSNIHCWNHLAGWMSHILCSHNDRSQSMLHIIDRSMFHNNKWTTLLPNSQVAGLTVLSMQDFMIMSRLTPCLDRPLCGLCWDWTSWTTRRLLQTNFMEMRSWIGSIILIHTQIYPQETRSKTRWRRYKCPLWTEVTNPQSARNRSTWYTHITLVTGKGSSTGMIMSWLQRQNIIQLTVLSWMNFFS